MVRIGSRVGLLVSSSSVTAVDFRELRGPLSDEEVAWITELYGPVDAKYRSPSYVQHQFVGNPFGWSVNVFAVAGGRAVGHCGVIPFHAVRGREPFVAGKLEALAVDAAFRGRRAEDGGSVATDILSRLYAFAVEEQIDVLFGLAPPAVARIHLRAGCHVVPTNAPAYTRIVDAGVFARSEQSRRRRVAARALGLGQRALVAPALPLSRPFRMDPPTEDDASLVSGDPGSTAWTVPGADAWKWLSGSGVLRTLALPGRFGSRALIRLDDIGGTTVQIVAWRPVRPTLATAFRLLGAVGALARGHHAPTLRFQPWWGDGDNGTLARACRLAGFVRRAEADLLLYPDDPEFDDVRLTPFFYVTF